MTPAFLRPTWQAVAVRVACPFGVDYWAWELTEAQQEELHAAKLRGTATTAQRREADGTTVLLAKAVAGPTGRRAVVAGREVRA